MLSVDCFGFDFNSPQLGGPHRSPQIMTFLNATRQSRNIRICLLLFFCSGKSHGRMSQPPLQEDRGAPVLGDGIQNIFHELNLKIVELQKILRNEKAAVDKTIDELLAESEKKAAELEQLQRQLEEVQNEAAGEPKSGIILEEVSEGEYSSDDSVILVEDDIEVIAIDDDSDDDVTTMQAMVPVTPESNQLQPLSTQPLLTDEEEMLILTSMENICHRMENREQHRQLTHWGAYDGVPRLFTNREERDLRSKCVQIQHLLQDRYAECYSPYRRHINAWRCPRCRNFFVSATQLHKHILKKHQNNF